MPPKPRQPELVLTHRCQIHGPQWPPELGIDASGQALADAALGASVKVRISDGKIIQGTAVSQGVVEVVME